VLREPAGGRVADAQLVQLLRERCHPRPGTFAIGDRPPEGVGAP
jgi:hypothetical protein